MKPKKIDGVEVWKDFEDLAHRLGLNVIERAVYSYLLRHTRLEGKLRERFTIGEVALQLRISRAPVRNALRRPAYLRVFRLVERSYGGYLVEVRLPTEVRGIGRKSARIPSKLRTSSAKAGRPKGAIDIEQVNFLNTTARRQAIHAREGGRCFYCRRRVPAGSRCLDHVVPQARFGQNSYRNLVSCCVECNWRKKDRRAPDFLRELYHEGRLSAKDLSARLGAVQALTAGKLRPQVFTREGAVPDELVRVLGAGRGHAAIL